MARHHENVIVRTLDTVLRARGFIRKKKTWFLAKQETVLVVDLQKSDWGKNYYVNLGILIRQLSPSLTPKINECQIMHRLEMLVQERDRGRPGQGTTPSDNQCKMKSMFDQLSNDPKHSIVVPTNDPSFFNTTGLHVPEIFKALDLEDQTMRDDDRVTIITNAMNTSGLPFLYQFESLAQIKKTLCEKDLSTTFVWKTVYELLGCTFPNR